MSLQSPRGIVGRRVVIAGALGIVAAVLARGRVLRVRVGRASRKIPRELVKFQRRDYTAKPALELARGRAKN